jgi:pimeloyl-ACP methyl ester carboxylesterase
MSFRPGYLLLAVILTVASASVAVCAARADFSGLVDIGGGRRMYLECRGKGSPTVVLVAGLRGSGRDWDIAETPGPTVFAGVANVTRVCAYDRPERRSASSRAGVTRCGNRRRQPTRSATCMPS